MATTLNPQVVCPSCSQQVEQSYMTEYQGETMCEDCADIADYFDYNADVLGE